jgi:hypothetical protein
MGIGGIPPGPDAVEVGSLTHGSALADRSSALADRARAIADRTRAFPSLPQRRRRPSPRHR